ncbi:hypothetical protein L1987_76519 [Smallanthus sonchifolius]|uniref:Uncharacterized protein n=1 Tax=Smallanthus sonchifolius TaxID=185202 RepID=A0ACB8Z705_9ASTR|nr:hypothetical protein L1987_76519 [Smallanthus sonchifolius]
MPTTNVTLTDSFSFISTYKLKTNSLGYGSFMVSVVEDFPISSIQYSPRALQETHDPTNTLFHRNIFASKFNPPINLFPVQLQYVCVFWCVKKRCS